MGRLPQTHLDRLKMERLRRISPDRNRRPLCQNRASFPPELLRTLLSLGVSLRPTREVSPAWGVFTRRVCFSASMLPNHPPLIVAEQFGTLESLYPGRIDLGLGRAPGTDAITTRACDETRSLARNNSRTMSRSCSAISRRRRPGSGCGRYPVPGSKYRCGYSVRACTARSSPRAWGCQIGRASCRERV